MEECGEDPATTRVGSSAAGIPAAQEQAEVGARGKVVALIRPTECCAAGVSVSGSQYCA